LHDAAASDRILPVSNRRIEILASAGRGRGVFAREPLASGTLIAAAPVTILPAAERRALGRTVIYDY